MHRLCSRLPRPHQRLASLAGTAVLALGLGLAALLPVLSPATATAFPQDAFVSAAPAGSLIQPGDLIHTDAIRKSGVACHVKNGSNNTARTEAWRLPASGLAYQVNTASFPLYLNSSQTLTAITNAATAWTAAGAPALTYAGTTATNGTIGDGANTIGFADLSGLNLGPVASVATMLIRSGVVVEADVVLDATNLWSTNPQASGECGGDPLRYDVQNAMTHEFGHWIGAAHTPLIDVSGYNHRTMYPVIDPGELQKRSPTPGDIASIPSQSVAPSSFSGTVSRSGDDDG